MFQNPLYLLVMEERLKRSQFCSVVILAAGKSSRMGSPKLGLHFDEKKTFLEMIIQQYKNFGCKEILVIINEDGATLIRSKPIEISSDVELIINTHLERGRFYSIKLGIKSLKEKYPVFIHNVDNPFVNNDVLSSLLHNSTNTDYVVPVFEGRGGHPILVSNKVSTAIKSEKKNDLILSDFLNNYTKKGVQVADKKVLTNINTEAAYLEFKDL